MRRWMGVVLVLVAACDCGGEGDGPGSRDAGPGCTPESCDDGIACTDDRCDGDTCLHVADDSACDEGEICRLDTGCFEPPRCSRADDPVCDDGQPCTADSCDLSTGRCQYDADDSACDDGLFCNGVEGCAPFRGCVILSVSVCDDGVTCTIDACDEESDTCSHLAEDRLCDDGVYCNGAETCDEAEGCQAGTAPTCDDSVACTVDSCDTATDACVNAAPDDDGDGDPIDTCGGGDCDDADDTVSSLATEVCNAVDDDCDDSVDEGVASECGDCDPTCRRRTVGMGGSDFDAAGMTGTELDTTLGGLTIQAVTTTNDYLWVPNTKESTLSRWDASSASEIGRYRVGLAAGECLGSCCWSTACNMPSRVAVDGNGDAYVANRGFGMQGTVTKIATDLADCVDRNSNGMIDTSIDSTPLAWGADECILWNAPVGPSNALLRALAIDGGDATHPEGYPWVGGYNVDKMWKLDPDTGAVLSEVDVPVSPYGAIVVADGKLWIGTLDEGATAWVDTVTETVSAAIPYPTTMRGGCINSYGITADARGRLWFSGWNCRDALGYDPAMDAWTRVNAASWGMETGRGITVDASGRIWMAVGGDGQSHVTFWNADDFVPGGHITTLMPLIRLPSGHTGPSGVGADASGDIWVAHHVSSQLVRIDPATLSIESFAGPNRVYTYSDFTGSVRRTVIGTGRYSQDFDAGCDSVSWADLMWTADTPAGTSVRFEVRTAATPADLDTATAVTVATAPTDTSPADIGAALTAAGVTAARHLRLVATLQADGSGTSPTLNGFSVTWHCP